MTAPTGQRPPKQTAREESDAYELATLRDKDTCQRCKRDCGPTARDHRKNRSQGGRTTVQNLQVLGLECHQWATEHPDDAVREGWAVPGWVTDPGKWPARRWLKTITGSLHLSWVLYNDDGTWMTIPDSEARRAMEGTA